MAYNLNMKQLCENICCPTQSGSSPMSDKKLLGILKTHLKIFDKVYMNHLKRTLKTCSLTSSVKNRFGLGNNGNSMFPNDVSLLCQSGAITTMSPETCKTIRDIFCDNCRTVDDFVKCEANMKPNDYNKTVNKGAINKLLDELTCKPKKRVPVKPNIIPQITLPKGVTSSNICDTFRRNMETRPSVTKVKSEKARKVMKSPKNIIMEGDTSKSQISFRDKTLISETSSQNIFGDTGRGDISDRGSRYWDNKQEMSKSNNSKMEMKERSSSSIHSKLSVADTASVSNISQARAATSVQSNNRADDSQSSVYNMSQSDKKVSTTKVDESMSDELKKYLSEMEPAEVKTSEAADNSGVYDDFIYPRKHRSSPAYMNFKFTDKYPFKDNMSTNANYTTTKNSVNDLKEKNVTKYQVMPPKSLEDSLKHSIKTKSKTVTNIHSYTSNDTRKNIFGRNHNFKSEDVLKTNENLNTPLFSGNSSTDENNSVRKNQTDIAELFDQVNILASVVNKLLLGNNCNNSKDRKNNVSHNSTEDSCEHLLSSIKHTNKHISNLEASNYMPKAEDNNFHESSEKICYQKNFKPNDLHLQQSHSNKHDRDLYAQCKQDINGKKYIKEKMEIYIKRVTTQNFKPNNFLFNKNIASKSIKDINENDSKNCERLCEIPRTINSKDNTKSIRHSLTNLTNNSSKPISQSKQLKLIQKNVLHQEKIQNQYTYGKFKSFTCSSFQYDSTLENHCQGIKEHNISNNSVLSCNKLNNTIKLNTKNKNINQNSKSEIDIDSDNFIDETKQSLDVDKIPKCRSFKMNVHPLSSKNAPSKYILDTFLFEPYAAHTLEINGRSSSKLENNNTSAFFSDQIRKYGYPIKSAYQPVNNQFVPVYKKVSYSGCPTSPLYTYYYSSPNCGYYYNTPQICQPNPISPCAPVPYCGYPSSNVVSRKFNVQTTGQCHPYSSGYKSTSCENVMVSTPTGHHVTHTDSSHAVHSNPFGGHLTEHQQASTYSTSGHPNPGMVCSYFPSPYNGSVCRSHSLTKHDCCPDGGLTTVASWTTCAGYPRSPLTDEIGCLQNRREQLIADVDKYNRDRELVVVAAERRNRLESVNEMVRHFENFRGSRPIVCPTYHPYTNYSVSSTKICQPPYSTRAVTFM